MIILQYIEPNNIRQNPDNPRFIQEEQFEKLVRSIQEFPEMLELRPLVVDEDMVLLGGNMRLKACIEVGLEKVPYVQVSNLTPKQKQEFIIKDNIGYGQWDIEKLEDLFNTEELVDWGLQKELFDFMDSVSADYSEANKEIDVEEFSDKMTLKFEVSEDEYSHIMEYLSKKNANKELALLEIVGYEA